MKPLLSLCATPPVLLRDGYVGVTAKILVPFLGYVYASGQTLTFPSSRIAQASDKRLSGLWMTNNYAKDCCDCSTC